MNVFPSGRDNQNPSLSWSVAFTIGQLGEFLQLDLLITLLPSHLQLLVWLRLAWLRPEGKASPCFPIRKQPGQGVQSPKQSGQRVESKEARNTDGGLGRDGLRGRVEGVGRLLGAVNAPCLVQPGLCRLEEWWAAYSRMRAVLAVIDGQAF